MKVFFFFFLSTSCVLVGQVHEIAPFLGGSNALGDIGSTKFINPTAAAFGVIYRRHGTTRSAFRIGVTISELNFSDFDSTDQSRLNRGFLVNNSIIEVSAGMEFNFYEFNLKEFNETKFTPYLFLGLSYFSYTLYAINSRIGVSEEYGSDMKFSLPVIVGVKKKLSKSLILGVETGIRYTFTDNLDGSSPLEEFETNAAYQHGSKQNNDWYVFTGITIGFTFGQREFCSCNK